MGPEITLSERLLKRDRAIVALSLTLLTLLAWLYLVVLVIDMNQGDMRLMGMGQMDPSMLTMVMPMAWDWSTFVLMGLMWWVMMIGMMVPSAAPMILLFARVQRKNLPHENPGQRISLFTAGYLFIWLVFSVAATVLQWALGAWDQLLPIMKTAHYGTGGVIFALAGLYQLTPLKRACLQHCQAPLTYLSQHWRHGNDGAWKMGLHHGAFCVGCCWVLMLLLFVGGVMNLVWIAVIAIAVLLEKLLPAGKSYTSFSGLALLSVGVWFFVS